ncbi:hypothetical protein [Tardiphaga robiniae]|uniref:hypothetical protein n=1 Tax=Tardiphaga robiniae TaxID=943830 RepID=UPI0015861798|nr:hypothetical protein [Tardiphaga robiniae]NUU44380.1 hypothetical protein [Tardiphaga robiniae]
MSGLDTLLCGDAPAEGLAKIALNQLSKSIDSFTGRAVGYLQSDFSEDTRTFGPFCARVILENGCAALLGRLDSFRILYLSEFQSQPEYRLGDRAKSSFSWTGDVMPDKHSAILWNPDSDVQKVSRALFSSHVDHIYWKPAVNEMLDFVSNAPTNAALADILSLDADTFIDKVRGQSSQLYSTLSKGVHWEFFSSSLVFGESTVKAAIRDSCLLMANLGLASHFVPTAYARVTPAKALEAYLAFRQDVP